MFLQSLFAWNSRSFHWVTQCVLTCMQCVSTAHDLFEVVGFNLCGACSVRFKGDDEVVTYMECVACALEVCFLYWTTSGLEPLWPWVRTVYSKPLNLLEPNLVWRGIIMIESGKKFFLKNRVFCLQSQGHDDGLYNENMTVLLYLLMTFYYIYLSDDCFYYIYWWLFLLYLLMTVSIISTDDCFYYIYWSDDCFYYIYWTDDFLSTELLYNHSSFDGTSS